MSDDELVRLTQDSLDPDAADITNIADWEAASEEERRELGDKIR